MFQNSMALPAGVTMEEGNEDEEFEDLESVDLDGEDGEFADLGDDDEEFDVDLTGAPVRLDD